MVALRAKQANQDAEGVGVDANADGFESVVRLWNGRLQGGVDLRQQGLKSYVLGAVQRMVVVLNGGEQAGASGLMDMGRKRSGSATSANHAAVIGRGKVNGHVRGPKHVGWQMGIVKDGRSCTRASADGAVARVALAVVGRLQLQSMTVAAAEAVIGFN